MAFEGVMRGNDVAHLCDATQAFSLHNRRSNVFFSIFITYDISMHDNILVSGKCFRFTGAAFFWENTHWNNLCEGTTWKLTVLRGIVGKIFLDCTPFGYIMNFVMMNPISCFILGLRYLEVCNFVSWIFIPFQAEAISFYCCLA